MQQLTALNPSPDVDRLIAALLPKLAQTEEIDPGKAEALIARAFPYELDPEIRSGYLRVLVSNGNAEGFKHLMEGLRQGEISEDEAEEILFATPERAFETLESAPMTDAHSHWIERLALKFPQIRRCD